MKLMQMNVLKPVSIVNESLHFTNKVGHCRCHLNLLFSMEHSTEMYRSNFHCTVSSQNCFSCSQCNFQRNGKEKKKKKREKKNWPPKGMNKSNWHFVFILIHRLHALKQLSKSKTTTERRKEKKGF